MSISTIRGWFQGKIATYATSKSYAVAYEGVEFKKPTSGIWLQCFLVPSMDFHPDVSCLTERKIGLFQVNVWGQKGKGMLPLETAAEEIKALFPVLPKDGVVSVEAPALIEKPWLDDSGWVILPITIKYRHES